MLNISVFSNTHVTHLSDFIPKLPQNCDRFEGWTHTALLWKETLTVKIFAKPPESFF